MMPAEVKRRTENKMSLSRECVLVVANPDNWNQNVNIQISPAPGHDFVSTKEFEHLSLALSEEMSRTLSGYKKLTHRLIEVAEVPALEMNFTSHAWDTKQRQRSVFFVKNEKLYTITCTAHDEEFLNADALAFQFIVDTITITDKER